MRLRIISRAVLVLCLVTAARAANYESITPEEAAIDVETELRANTVAGFLRLRQQIILEIFDDATLPHNGADRIYELSPDPWLTSGASISRWEFDLGRDVRSMAYSIRANRSLDCLFIYYFGHGEGFRVQQQNTTSIAASPEAGVQRIINALVENGCDVITLSLPFSGDNPVVIRDGSPLHPVDAHNDLSRLETSNWSPLQFFVAPAVRVINQAAASKEYATIGLAGKSGGSWAATLVAAIDPRVRHSYSINGTFPMYLRRARPPDLGDWEQSRARLWSKTDDLNLYVLGALDAGRTTDLIWRKYDPCCFQGMRAFAFMPRLIEFISTMSVSGMTFFVDEEAVVTHDITDVIAERVIQNFLQHAAAPLFVKPPQ